MAFVCLMTVFSTGLAPAQAVGLRRLVPYEAQWHQYRARFLKSDGRVVDTGNHEITHSESQGTGMLFSLFAGDRGSFDRIWSWTRAHLRRKDGLFSWKYDPTLPGSHVPDPNNATDGDLLLAWALLLGATVWDERNYQDEADTIIQALEANVVESFGDRFILRPGEVGYTGLGRRILNLSYCVFPALQEIAAHTQSQLWIDIYRDCLMFVKKAGFGSLALPLDWVEFSKDGRVSPAPDRPARFGYDAIRVPLYLVWAGHATPAYIERYGKAWGRYPANEAPPSWIDPISGRTARYRAASGFLAVRRLVDLAMRQGMGQRARSLRSISLPVVTNKDDYYSASLVMFATLAAQALDP